VCVLVCAVCAVCAVCVYVYVCVCVCVYARNDHLEMQLINALALDVLLARHIVGVALASVVSCVIVANYDDVAAAATCAAATAAAAATSCHVNCHGRDPSLWCASLPCSRF